MSWAQGTLCGLDFESTGLDVELERIVTACIVRVDGSGKTAPAGKKWLINPGIEISAEASAIHGITTEQARTAGDDPAVAIAEITETLRRALTTGTPIVGFNVGGYDLTLLDRECRRYGIPVLDPLMPVIDGLVLDKHVVEKRSGQGARKLTALSKVYGVRLDDAHDASADALAAVGVACRIAERFPHIGRLSLPALHALQVTEKAKQDENFANYLRSQAARARTADEQIELWARADAIKGHWPVAPYEAQQGALT